MGCKLTYKGREFNNINDLEEVLYEDYTADLEDLPFLKYIDKHKGEHIIFLLDIIPVLDKLKYRKKREAIKAFFKSSNVEEFNKALDKIDNEFDSRSNAKHTLFAGMDTKEKKERIKAINEYDWNIIKGVYAKGTESHTRHSRDFLEEYEDFDFDKPLSFEVLDSIVEDYGNDQVKLLWGIIKDRFKEADTKVIFNYFENIGPNAAGVFYANIIRVNTNHTKSEIAAVFVHEAIHAVTSIAIALNSKGSVGKEFLTERQRDGIDKLNKIYKYVEKNAKFKAYGLYDEHEFLAELSNEKFVKKLKEMHMPGEKKTLWGRIVEAIERIIFGDKRSNVYEDTMNILDDFLSAHVENFEKNYIHFSIKDGKNTNDNFRKEEIIEELDKTKKMLEEIKQEKGLKMTVGEKLQKHRDIFPELVVKQGERTVNDSVANAKLSISNKYIGITDRKSNLIPKKGDSSTRSYAMQIAKIKPEAVNPDTFNSDDVVFMSIPGGKQNNSDLRNRNKTLVKVVDALEAGAVVLTDPIVKANSDYNKKGEGYIREKLIERGYQSENIIINGEDITAWYKKTVVHPELAKTKIALESITSDIIEKENELALVGTNKDLESLVARRMGKFTRPSLKGHINTSGIRSIWLNNKEGENLNDFIDRIIDEYEGDVTREEIVNMVMLHLNETKGAVNRIGTKESEKESITEEIEELVRIQEALLIKLDDLENYQDPLDPELVKEEKLSFITLKLEEAIEHIEKNKRELEEIADEVEGELFSDEIINAVNSEMSSLPGITLEEERQFIQYLFVQITQSTFNHTKGNIGIEKKFNDFLQTRLNLFKNKKKEFLARQDLINHNEYTRLVNLYESALKSRRALIKKAIYKVELDTVLSFKEDEDVFEHETTENDEEKIYSKENIEVNAKKQGSALLKSLYANTKARSKSGKILITKETSLIKYMTYDEVDDVIKKLLVNVNKQNPSLSDMLSTLKEHEEDYPFLKDIINKLQDPSTDTQYKNIFVVENARHNLIMNFIMFHRDETGKYVLKTYNTNRNKIETILKKEWEYNSQSNEELYVMDESGDVRISSSYSERVMEKFSNAIGNTKGYKNKKDLYRTITKLAKAKQGSPEYNILKNSFLNFLNDVGISITEETYDEYLNTGEDYFDKNNKKVTIKPSKLFSMGSGFNLFGSLLNRMHNFAIIGEDTNVTAYPDRKLLANLGTGLNLLAKREAKKAYLTAVTSFRDGSKSVYAMPLGKFATDMTNMLKHDEDYRNMLREEDEYGNPNRAFQYNSIWLNFLESDKFKENFNIFHNGITALKEMGERVLGKNKITDLTAIDYDLIELGYFQDIDTWTSGEVHYDMRLRGAKYLFPTMSDKSQMMNVSSLAFILTQEHVKEDGGVAENVKQLLYDQVVLPELLRILDYTRKNKTTDIKGYDVVAKSFIITPQLNDFKFEIDGEEYTFREIFKEHDNDTINELLSDFEIMEKFEAFAKEKLNNIVKEEVANKTKEWKKHFKDKDGYKALNQDYIRTLTGNKGILMATDFVVNKMVALANMNMLFVGDPALYNTKLNEAPTARKSKDVIYTNMGKRLALLLAPRTKFADADTEEYRQIFLEEYLGKSQNLKYLTRILDGVTITDEELKIIDDYNKHVTKEKELKDDELVEDILEKYQKLKDFRKENPGVKEPSNLLLTKEEKEAIKAFASKSMLEGKFKELENKFYKSSEYFSIEGADGQEYTTVEEHIYILHKTGRISDKDMITVMNKVQQQRRYLKDNPGKPIPRYMHISTAHLKLVFQPMKPVHTGFMNDTKNGLMRMMYIKSSSFPLIPQLTHGMEIDKLRKTLEEAEQREGSQEIRLYDGTKIKLPKMPVRAVFQSAVKVGGLSNPVRIVNVDNTYNGALTMDEVIRSSKVLSRFNFGIQNNVPAKFTKGNFKVSLGTQTLKLLFGGGMMLEEGFDYVPSVMNGVETIEEMLEGGEIKPNYTGTELQRVFNKVWVNYISEKKDIFLEEFGLDKNFKPTNVLKTAKKYQRIIEEEIASRKLPLQDARSLELSVNVTISINGHNKDTRDVKLKDIDQFRKDYKNKNLDNKILKELGLEGAAKNGFKMEIDYHSFDFALPVWLSASSNKYEALFNSIVSKKLIHAKLPGNSYVVASEALFKKDPIAGGIDESRIVYIGTKYDPEGLKSAQKNEDGTFTKTQVLLPSRFTNNMGKIIELIYKDGTYNEKYVKEKNGRLELKEEMFGDGMLDYTSFRTPTSSHVSMSQVEVVGFLPPEVGDLMVVPKSLIIQKGLDFDIDKETVYIPHHYVDENGVVSKVGGEKYENVSESIQRNYEEAKEDYFNNTKDRVAKKIYNEAKDKVKLFNKNRTLKYYENEILSIHRSILTNSNDSVQKKINAVLSMKFAGEQASHIDDIFSKDIDLDNFSPYTNTYQRSKSLAGSMGKMGIGVYSSALTVHSLMEQLRLESDDVGISHPLEDMEFMSFVGQDGDNKMGNFGKIMTRDGDRSIAEVFAELQNIATDNEKAQIMGRLNINTHTIGVQTYLTLLGYDKVSIKDLNGKNRKMSIPFMFINQPIIKLQVKLLEERRAKVNRDIPNSEDKINTALINGLLKKAGQDGDFKNMKTLSKVKGKYFSKIMANITPQQMYGGLSHKMSAVQQAAVLYTFSKIKTTSVSFVSNQSGLNITKEGLGKSFFDTISKYEFLYKVSRYSPSEQPTFPGFENLIGDIRHIDQLEEGGKERLLSEGYIEIKNLLIRPTTPIGAMLTHSVQTSLEVSGNIFPYHSDSFTKIIEDGFDVLGISENTNERNKLEVKQTIIKELKKYIFSSNSLGFYTDVNKTRYDLILKKDGMDTLNKYIFKLIHSKKFRHLQNNPIFKHLSFEFSSNRADLIRYNNSKQDNYEEEIIYKAIPELFNNVERLPDFNGKKYTTLLLAEDLIRYAFAVGGVQEALEYVKYIPSEVLQVLPYGKRIGPFIGSINLSNIQPFYSQLAQHKPLLTREIVEDNVTKFKQGIHQFRTHEIGYIAPLMWENLAGFTLIEHIDDNGETWESTSPEFLHKTYYEGKKLRTKLFKKVDGTEKTYELVSIKGGRNHTEYNFNNFDTFSLYNQNIPKTETDMGMVNYDKNKGDYGYIKEGDITGTIQRIIRKGVDGRESLSHWKRIVQVLEASNVIDHNMGLRVDFDIPPHVAGQYDRNNNEIVLNGNLLNYSGRIFVKELLHSVVDKTLEKELDKDGNIIADKDGAVTVFAYNLKQYYDAYTNKVKVKYGDTYETYKKKIEEGSITVEDQIAYSEIYPTTNLREFAEMMFTDNLTRKFADTLTDDDVPGILPGENISEDFFKKLDYIFKEKMELGIPSRIISNIVEAINFSEKFKKIPEKSDIFNLQKKASEKIDEAFASLDSIPLPEEIGLPPIENEFESDAYEEKNILNQLPIEIDESKFNNSSESGEEFLPPECKV